MKKILLLLLIAVSISNYAQTISAGGYYSLTICNDGTVEGWGRDDMGQVGNDTAAFFPCYCYMYPDQASFLSGIIAIDAGQAHSLALKNDSTIWSWGHNHKGELGNGTLSLTGCNCVTTPAQIAGLSGFISIAAGGAHSLALKNDGTVWAWGFNAAGQLGNGVFGPTGCNCDSVPHQVLGLSGITAISCSHSNTSIALKNDGTVWCWGENNSGQLGDSTLLNRNIPVQVYGLTNVISIDAGAGRSLALRSDSTVWNWGNNSSGQLGDSTTINRTTPVQVRNLTDIISIAGGDGHSLALKNNGTVMSWGYNNTGQLGDSTAINRIVPVQVHQLSGIISIAAGGSHSIALKNNGTLWSFGDNMYHQHADGTQTDRYTPVQVNNLCSITVNENESIKEPLIVIFPNPFTSQTTITFGEEHASTGSASEHSIKINNVLGEEIKTIHFTGKQCVIEKAEMKPGIYFVSITNEKKKVVNRKIVLQ